MLSKIRQLDDGVLRKLQEDQTIILRPQAHSGLWCGLILPLALILSVVRYSDQISLNYQLTAMSTTVMAIFLLMKILHGTPELIYVLALILNCLLFAITGLGLVTTFIISSCIIGLSTGAYSLLLDLFRSFPASFSVGEGLLVIEGLGAFVFSIIANVIIRNVSTSTIFAQVLLSCLGIFLTVISLKTELKQVLFFSGTLLFIVTPVTLMTLALTLQDNPIAWFLEFLLMTRTRISLIFYWMGCSVSAILIAWGLGGSGIPLTILRKYFHGIVIGVYVPGIWLDTELLFIATIVALCAFLFIEALRLWNIGSAGALLNQSLSAFLDEKDQGNAILTHIYLLVGSSLPLWIYPLNFTSSGTLNTHEILILSSGIFALGVGDTAASVGGTLWGRNKIPGTSKTIEGTICSIVAQTAMATLLISFGLLDAARFPWPTFLFAAITTSLVEALTSQVDNLVLPLVTYILLIV